RGLRLPPSPTGHPESGDGAHRRRSVVPTARGDSGPAARSAAGLPFLGAIPRQSRTPPAESGVARYPTGAKAWHRAATGLGRLRQVRSSPGDELPRPPATALLLQGVYAVGFAEVLRAHHGRDAGRFGRSGIVACFGTRGPGTQSPGHRERGARTSASARA